MHDAFQHVVCGVPFVDLGTDRLAGDLSTTETECIRPNIICKPRIDRSAVENC